MSLKMKGAILDQLVYRLRSGRYKQGPGALRARESARSTVDADDVYCCLGVLCEMAVEANEIQRSGPDRDGMGGGKRYGYGSDADLMAYSYLPDKVVEWAGMESDFEKVETDDCYYEQRGAFEPNKSLALMNDKGMPFSEIADWLVENVVRV